MNTVFQQKQTKETKARRAPAFPAFVPFVSFCSTLVERILAAKRANPAADTTAWEREIDQRVYRLYALTKVAGAFLVVFRPICA